MKFHLHKFSFESDTINGHKHKLTGYAGNMLGIGNYHFHFFYGVCSYDNHTHYFSGITGMPEKTENGHIHKMEGILESYNLHNHDYKGFTFEEISYLTLRHAVSC